MNRNRVRMVVMAAAWSVGAFRGVAVDFEAIPFWTGSGTNRAAVVIHWSAPEVRQSTTVPNPVADRSLAWGYRWNGSATAEEMVRAVLAADPRLFATVHVSQFGASVLGFGYDLNNNGVFGVEHGTNVFAPAAFTNGIVAMATSSADAVRSADPGDLFWSGWNGPGWETWSESGSAGGRSSAPSRGTEAYWTPADRAQPYFGSHGEWELAGAGISFMELKDGSWVGFTVAGGAFDFFNPDSESTLAYSFKKQAPAAPEWAGEARSRFAVEVVSASGPFGAAPHDDPASVLGRPSTDFFDPFGEVGGGTKARRVKLVEGAFGTDAQTNKLITTLGEGSSIIVRFEEPVMDHPANPYGIDLLVFGNSTYGSDGFVNDAANMNEMRVMGGVFAEPMKISVSPGYTGLEGEVENDPATWPWHRYESGPFADSTFPTQGYHWNRESAAWSPLPMDFTRPVNPEFAAVLAAGGMTVAEAIALYNGSGGGTGFDLAESGFSMIRYARVEGVGPEFSGGEIDGFAAVRPASVGDSVAVGPQSPTKLLFEDPGEGTPSIGGRVEVRVKELSGAAAVGVQVVSATNLVSAGVVLQSVKLAVAPLLTESVTFEVDATVRLDGIYAGDGTDLNVLRWDGAKWIAAGGFSYEGASNAVVMTRLTNEAMWMVERVAAPTVRVAAEAGTVEVEFAPNVGWVHTLERTTDFVNWIEAGSVTPTAAEMMQVRDETPPNGNAFYRVRLSRAED